MSEESQLSKSLDAAVVDVKDKIVLVTGANRGIGKAFVDVLLRRGVSKVYAGVRNVAHATEDVFQTYDKNKVVPIYIDLSKPESIEKAATIAKDVHVVINNAGILMRLSEGKESPSFSLFDREAITNFQQEMAVNVYGLMYVAQHFLPVLQTNLSNDTDGTAAFIQINSVGSFRCAVPQVCTYSASKAAAYSFTQSIRKSLQESTIASSQRIRVLSVHPGPIATDMIVQAGADFVKLAESPTTVHRSR